MITTRVVAAVSWANELNSPKPMTLNRQAAAICSRGLPRAIEALRPCSRISANKATALIEYPSTRNVKTPISSSAIFMIGQLKPQ